MPERSLEWEVAIRQHNTATPPQPEFVLLTADQDGETLVVELITIHTTALNYHWLRRYVGGVLVWQIYWPAIPAPVAPASVDIEGPFVLVGSSSAPQELRLEYFFAGPATTTATIHYTRE